VDFKLFLRLYLESLLYCELMIKWYSLLSIFLNLPTNLAIVFSLPITLSCSLVNRHVLESCMLSLRLQVVTITNHIQYMRPQFVMCWSSQFPLYPESITESSSSIRFPSRGDSILSPILPYLVHTTPVEFTRPSAPEPQLVVVKSLPTQLYFVYFNHRYFHLFQHHSALFIFHQIFHRRS